MSTRWPARIVFGTAGTAGVLLVIVSLVVPTTAVAGGGRTLEAWWTAQFGLAICLAGVAAYPGWRRAALLGALFLLATGAQLALTSPLWLQYLELRPRMLVTGTRPVALAVLGLQGVTVLVGMRGRLRDLVAGVRRLMTVRVVMVAVLLLVLAGAHASIFYPHFPAPYYVAGYVAQLVAVGALFALNAVHLWLLARALPADVLSRLGERIDRAITLPGQVRPPTRIDRWVPWLLAAFVAVLSGWLAVTVFERVPHMEDEVAFIFQAKQLASFGLTGPAPPVPDAFMTYLLDTEAGRWFATTKPGWPLVLAIGVSAGAPWLVNPVLAAVCVLLLHALALRLTDRGTAHLVGLLGATSPWVLFLAASQMGHILPLLLTVGAFLLIHMAVERQRPFLALAAGLALGYGVLTRPLDGVVVGVLAGVYLLIESRVRWRLLIPFAVGCVGGSIGLLPYNAGVSGAPLRDPMMGYLDRLWYPGANRLGFGDDIGPPGGWGNLDPAPGHGLAEAVLNANQNLYNLNFELHGWALGSLLLIFAYLAFGRQSRLDRRLWVFSLALVATYSLYWFSGGPDFGPRYWFLLIVPALLWSARGLTDLSQAFREAFDEPLASLRMTAILGLLVLVSLVTFVPWRAVARYEEYRGFHADYLRLQESGELGRALVLVETDGGADWGSALFLNYPTLPDDRPVLARDLGPESNLRLMEAFADRPVIRLRGRRGPGDHVTILDRTADRVP